MLIASVSGEGWVVGPGGALCWGRFGAAGVLVHDSGRVLLQHRSQLTHNGGTWSIPGGALAAGESAIDGALREAFEECGLPREAVTPQHEHHFDLGSWRYTTIVARLTVPFAIACSSEATTHRWVDQGDVDALPLHSSFEASWPDLRRLIA